MAQKRILIIDDEEVNRLLLEELIRSFDSDIELVSVDNASEGIFHYLTSHFDIVLLDIMMPVLDGNDFLAIVEKNRQTGNLKIKANIIVQTAIQSISQLTQLTKWECVLEVIRKPIVASRIQECLNKYLN